MNTVIVAENPFEPKTWETHKVEMNIFDFVKKRFPKWPETARIYHSYVATSYDVTPIDDNTLDELRKLEGRFYVMIYPANKTAFLIGGILFPFFLGPIALVMLLRPNPEIPQIAAAGSSNNSISDRQNRARPLERIPDIFGTVRSTPDMLSVPYRKFINNVEYEFSYFCIGRGRYDISDVRDGTDPLNDVITLISGTGVRVFGPDTSPNSGTAELTVGDQSQMVNKLYITKRMENINGQTLLVPNIVFHTQWSGVDTWGHICDVRYAHVGTDYYLELLPDSGQNFKEYYAKGQSITIHGSSTSAMSLDGTYIISEITTSRMYLGAAPGVNGNWNSITGDINFQYDLNMWIQGMYGENWTGPVLVKLEGVDHIVTNFVAPNGLYVYCNDDNAFIDGMYPVGDPLYGQTDFDNTTGTRRAVGKGQHYLELVIAVEVTPCDAYGTAYGSASTYYVDIKGSDYGRYQIGATLEIGPLSPSSMGYYSIRAKRMTARSHVFDTNGYNTIDQITWRDLYGSKQVTQSHFGNVTTVQAVTQVNRDAAAIKNRKLNMLVTRKLPAVGAAWDSTTVVATNWADAIISYVSQDPYIGGRSPSEIDFTQISSIIGLVKAHFGVTNVCGQFCYTFDKLDISFEETIGLIAKAAFCTAYRQGNVIRLKFEDESSDATLLFNHRNKVPKTELRTVRFGNEKDYDGVEFTYISPVDDEKVTYYVPEDLSAVNPKKIDSVGIRSKIIAYYHTWREWNKIRYQNIGVEFEATQEAELLVLGECILVADNTRPETQDGEVVAQDGLIITLSQPIDLT